MSSESCEPNRDPGQKHHGKEVRGELFVACGNAPISFELLEEALHQMSLDIEVSVEQTRNLSVLLRRNYRDAMPSAEALEQTVTVVASVGEDVSSAHVLRERFSKEVVVPLTLGEFELDRISEGVHTNVNLCGESAPRSSDGLLATFF